VAEPDDTNVIDLMSALRASLEGKEKAAPPAKKPAQKAASAAKAKPAKAKSRKAG
jgi:DNA end-binding protein Ku